MAQNLVLTSAHGNSATVWSVIERKLLETCGNGGRVVWLTFNFDPPEKVLARLKKHNLRLDVVCAHAQAPVHVSAFRRASSRLGSACTIRYFAGAANEALHADGAAPSGEVPTMHAKAVLFWREGQEEQDVPAACFVGSFNFSSDALFRNIETILEVGQDDRRHIWEIARDWTPMLVKLVEDDCHRQVRSPSAAIVDGPAATGSTGLATAAVVPVPARCDPEVVWRLQVALHEMMATFPDYEESRGWQLGMWQRLEQARPLPPDRPTQLLYLPVGVGKTFIALRWLLERISGATVPGLFLVPNEWVQRSVQADLLKVAERAGLSQQAVASAVCVQRYTADFEARVWPAVVVDEVHNWNADATLGVARRVREATNDFSRPTLGLSATPCRMDHNQFVVKSFVAKFLGRSRDEDARPGLLLREAIRMRLIAPYRFQPLRSCERVVKNYWEADHAQLSFGDYSEIVLRDIWHDIAYRKADRLAKEVFKFLPDRKRIIVFLPPVAEAADEFVNELNGLAVESGGAGTCFVDFRSRNEGAAPAKRFEEFRNHDTSKGPAFLVTIDRFGEGVSVSDIDALVMLRATLSPRVAVQALGRGLRLHKGKEDCLILDGVGFERLVDKWDGKDHGLTDVAMPTERALTAAEVMEEFSDYLRVEHRKPHKDTPLAASTQAKYVREKDAPLAASTRAKYVREVQRDVEREVERRFGSLAKETRQPWSAWKKIISACRKEYSRHPAWKALTTMTGSRMRPVPRA